VGKDGKKTYLDAAGQPVKSEDVQVIIDEQGNEIFLDKKKFIPKKSTSIEKKLDKEGNVCYVD